MPTSTSSAATRVRLVQLQHVDGERRIALVSGARLRLLGRYRSAHGAAMAAITLGQPLATVLRGLPTVGTESYDAVYRGASAWRLLPAFDHPASPGSCLVAGTGLTHLGSARNRNAMHAAAAAALALQEGTPAPTAETAGVSVATGEPPATDSMRMFQWGVEGGKPDAGTVGVQPEWFYKGDGSILRAHGEALTVPDFGNDGGEEPEIAAVYVVGLDGVPYRVGLCAGNEFSDHVMEKKNYLYLAPSKLRECAIGPELVVGAAFDDIRGEVKVSRGSNVLWSSPIATGEANMTHTLENLEHHHFKYPAHRQAGQAHVHFFGADAFSFGGGVLLNEGDTMSVTWNGFGRPLVNPLHVVGGGEQLVTVRSL